MYWHVDPVTNTVLEKFEDIEMSSFMLTSYDMQGDYIVFLVLHSSVDN